MLAGCINLKMEKLSNNMEKEIGIAMIAAANKAIEYTNKNFNSSIEEVLSHVMENANYKGELKLGAIVSASAAFHFRERNPRAKDREVFQFILNKIPELVKEITAKE